MQEVFIPPTLLPVSGVVLEEDKGIFRYVTLCDTFEFIICEMLQGPIKIEQQVIQVLCVALGYSIKDPSAVIKFESFFRAACDGIC